jgi:hypothetical protein
VGISGIVGGISSSAASPASLGTASSGCSGTLGAGLGSIGQFDAFVSAFGAASCQVGILVSGALGWGVNCAPLVRVLLAWASTAFWALGMLAFVC